MADPRIRRPLAIFPSRWREGLPIEFGIARTDGRHLTMEDYKAIRQRLGMTELDDEEVLAIFGLLDDD